MQQSLHQSKISYYSEYSIPNLQFLICWNVM